MAPVVQAARRLESGHVVLVTSTFRPVPLIEVLEAQGFRTFTRQRGTDRFETFVGRPPPSNYLQDIVE